LDDYALLIEALLTLFEVTQNTDYLEKSGKLMAFVIKNFYDETSKLFFFTSAEQTDIIIRKKDLYDNALPSGNSTMVHNLQQLGILLGNEKYKEMAFEMLRQVQSSIEKYPTSFAKWANAMLFMVHPLREIAIIGKKSKVIAKAISNHYLPNRVIMATDTENQTYPLLEGKAVGNETLIFVCQNYACQLPLRSVDEMMRIINAS
jgi:uncharacterized protein YyaL (SSP411 family)